MIWNFSPSLLAQLNVCECRKAKKNKSACGAKNPAASATFRKPKLCEDSERKQSRYVQLKLKSEGRFTMNGNL